MRHQLGAIRAPVRKKREDQSKRVRVQIVRGWKNACSGEMFRLKWTPVRGSAMASKMLESSSE